MTDEWLKNAYAHREEIATTVIAIAIAWTPFATMIAAKVKRPDPSAKWWWRALYDLFVDVPAWIAANGRFGFLGGKLNLPGLPSRHSSDNPVPPPPPITPPPPPVASEVKPDEAVTK